MGRTSELLKRKKSEAASAINGSSGLSRNGYVSMADLNAESNGSSYATPGGELGGLNWTIRDSGKKVESALQRLDQLAAQHAERDADGNLLFRGRASLRLYQRTLDSVLRQQEKQEEAAQQYDSTSSRILGSLGINKNGYKSVADLNAQSNGTRMGLLEQATGQVQNSAPPVWNRNLPAPYQVKPIAAAPTDSKDMEALRGYRETLGQTTRQLPGRRVGNQWVADPEQAKTYQEAWQGMRDVNSQIRELESRADYVPKTSVQTISENLEDLRDMGSLAKNSVLEGMATFNAGVANTLALPSRIAAGLGVDEKYLPAIQWAEDRTRVAEQFGAAKNEIAEQYGFQAQLGANLLSGITSAAPNAILAILSGGGSAVTQLAPHASGIAAAVSSGVKTMATNPMYWNSFISTVGNEYQAAVDNGADTGTALVAALTSSLLNSAVEVGGGVETLPGELRGTDVNRIAAWLRSGLDEGKEEVFQSAISNFVQKMLVDRSTPFASLDNSRSVIQPGLLSDFGYGAGIGLILGGGELFASHGKGAQTNPAMERVLDSVNEVVDGQKDSAASGSETKRPIQMEDFRNNDSSVWTMLDYDDVARQNDITQTVRQQMIDNGAVVELSGEQAAQYYPDLRSMKKSERTPILKQKINALKQSLRTFLSGLKDSTFEFDVNDNILEARLYDTGIREVLEKLTQEKAGMLYGSDAIFRNARYLYSTPDYAGDPNIYRWNYFYTPVSIDGGEPVGVRIAVRDVDKGTNFTPESQIYNWNIKKNAALDGGRRDPKAASSDVSSAAFSNAPLDGGSPSTRPPSSGISSGAFSEEALDGGGGEQIASHTGVSSASSRDSVPQSQAQYNPNFNQNQGGDTGSPESKVSQVRQNTFERSNVFNQAEKSMDALSEGEFTYDPVSEKQSINHAIERLNLDFDGEAADLAIREAWSGEDLDTAMGILGAKRNEARQSGDYTEVRAWAKLIQEHGTAGGQFLQAFAKYTRTPEGILVKAADTMARAKVSEDVKNQVLGAMENFAETLDTIGASDKNALIDLIKQQAKQRNTKISKVTENFLNKSDTKFLYDFALKQLENIAVDYEKVSKGKRISTFQTLMQLLNLKTFNRNLGANQLFDIVDSVASDVSMLPDLLLSAVTGKRTVGFNKSWFSEQKRSGAAKGLRNSWIEVALDVDAGDSNSKYGTSGRRTNKMTGKAAERFFSRLEKVMGFELNVTDEFHKGGVRGEVLESLAPFVERGYITREQALEWARQEALYRSFQDDTLPGHILGRLKGLMNTGVTYKDGKFGTKQLDFGLGDFVQKYTQVPGALISRAVEYTPLGYVKAITNLARLAQSKGMDINAQRRAALDIGRATTGTGLITLFAALTANGLLHRADDEDDKDIAALNSAEGISGTQLNITAALDGRSEWQEGDTLISLDFLEPINALMTVGSMIADDESTKNYLQKLTDHTLEGTFEALLDTPTMQSMQTIFDTIRYYDPDDEDSISPLLEIPIEIAKGSITGFVPSPARQAAQAMDGTYRDTYSSDSKLEQTVDAFLNTIPVLRETLPEKTDNYGRTKTYTDNPILDWMNSMVFPGNINTYKQSEVSKELNSIREATGETAFYPDRKAPRYIKAGETKYDLTPQQRQTYQKTLGGLYYDTMNEAAGMELYRDMTGEERAEFAADVKELATAAAQTELRESFGLEYENSVMDAAYQAAQGGASVPEYLAFRVLYDQAIQERKDAGESYSERAESAKIIEQMAGLSNEAKSALWETKNGDDDPDTIDERNPYTGTLAAHGVAVEDIIYLEEKYKEYQNLKDGDKPARASDQAAELSKWLDGQDFNDTQRKYIDEMYQYSWRNPASPTPYNRATMTKSQGKMYDTWGKGHGYEDVEKFLKYYNVVKETRASDEYKGYASQSRKDSLVKDKLVEAGMKNRTEAGNFLNNYE